MKESEHRKKLDIYFQKHFNIDVECWSKCSTKRIDYILECKTSKVLFGVEVKSDEHLTGIKLGEYLNQAFGYSKLKFKTKFSNDPVKVLIFITPAISNYIKEIIPGTLLSTGDKEYYQTYHKHGHEHSNVNSFIGFFNVGEIRQNHNSYFFSFRNTKIWDSKNGLRENNYKKVINKILI